MSENLEILHPSTGECRIWDCPCHEFSAKSPLESIQGYQEPSEGEKIDSTRPSASGIAISGFGHEWNHAPSGRRRRVEMEDALFWYTTGARAKEAELMEVFNGDLRELLRIAGERIIR